MCGRTCLTLEPKQVVCACKYKKTSIDNKDETKPKKMKNKGSHNNEESVEQYLTPDWRPEFNCGRKYEPSYNLAPTDISPVIVSADHFDNDCAVDGHTRVVVPMMWGIIPFWHKGDYRKHGLTTNNCRLENMLESKLYRGPFQRGQRCVVLCEGFYEWQTTKPAKSSERAAYLLHMPQPEGVQLYDKTTWCPENINLLKMAGLFDVWEDENGDKMFSYSVITFEATKVMSWLHHRMPAILETEEQMDNWLDYKRVSNDKALSALRAATDLKWHRVSRYVNNSRNKSEQCNKPIELCAEPKPASVMNKTMSAWLKVRQPRDTVIDVAASSNESESVNDPKRPKLAPA